MANSARWDPFRSFPRLQAFDEEKEGGKVLRSERYYGAMYRSFTLPTDVDQAKADAKYTDGVLQVVMPKKAGAGVKKLEVH